MSASSAGSQTELSQPEKEAIVHAIEARMDGYKEAAFGRDIDWFLDFWADVKGFRLAGDGDLLDRDTWVQGLRLAVAETKEMLNFEFFDRNTYVLGPDAAAHSTRFRWEYETTNGDTLRAHGSWIHVFQKMDGIWKVVHSGGTHVSE